ncbi:MAG TPA: cytochrome c3 family protein [Polyangiaceae bacterium]
MKRAWALYGMLLAGIVAAACGGAAQNGPVGTTMPTGSAAPSPTETASATPTASASATPTSSATPATTATPGPGPAPEVIEMKSPIPSAMVADLQALGLDAKNLPPIEKLEPKTLRGVMKLLAKSLGAKCADCHTEGDFAAQTRRKKIAAKMWDEFVAKLSLGLGQGSQTNNQGGGQPLFCDSCHQGRIKQLDRSDKKALGKWMDANFAQKLVRKDGKDEACESCHVDWDMTFLAKWGGGAGN